jgi:hypothetical protein
MGLKLDHILAGKALPRCKGQAKRLVHRLSVIIAQDPQ